MKSYQELVTESGKPGASYGGWITDPDKAWLVEFMQRSWAPDALFVEVGTYRGSGANLLLLAAGAGPKVVALDNWKDGQDPASHSGFNTMRDCFVHDTSASGYYPDRIQLIEGDSRQVGSSWSRPIDMLYVDGDHSYELAASDIRLFSRWVKVGGYLLVDDFDMPDVRRAVADEVREGWLTLRVPVPAPAKLWAAQRAF